MPIFNALWLGNNQTVTFLKPPVPSGPNLYFVATDPAHPAAVDLGTTPPVGGQINAVWTFQSVVANGYGGHNYGSMSLEIPYGGTVDLLHGVNISNASISLSATDGGAYTLNGGSITDHSVLTAWGGRYAAIGLPNVTYSVNGNFYVNTDSVANFDNAKLAGTGTIHVASGGTVDATTIVKGLRVDVDRGGTLQLLHPNSAGTIIEAAGGKVLIGGATTATHEIFHEASGTLDLLNKSGVQVASLKFAPGSHEYTSIAPIHGGLLEITTNPMMAGNLHTTFTS